MTEPKKDYICNNPDKSEHCLTNCLHGVPHVRDHCTQKAFCNLGKGNKIKKVWCRRLTKKEEKAFEKANR